MYVHAGFKSGAIMLVLCFYSLVCTIENLVLRRQLNCPMDNEWMHMVELIDPNVDAFVLSSTISRWAA